MPSEIANTLWVQYSFLGLFIIGCFVVIRVLYKENRDLRDRELKNSERLIVALETSRAVGEAQQKTNERLEAAIVKVAETVNRERP